MQIFSSLYKITIKANLILKIVSKLVILVVVYFEASGESYVYSTGNTEGVGKGDGLVVRTFETTSQICDKYLSTYPEFE